MLLVLLMGLIAKLALVWGDFGVGTTKLDNFEWTKFAGPEPWYFLLHDPGQVSGNFACPIVMFAIPVDKKSVLTASVRDTSKQTNAMFEGYITNWNSTGYYDVMDLVPKWNGPFQALAVDYNSYVIVKHRPLDSSDWILYVGFRSSRPDLQTVMEVVKQLQENFIDVREMEEWGAKYCQ